MLRNQIFEIENCFGEQSGQADHTRLRVYNDRDLLLPVKYVVLPALFDVNVYDIDEGGIATCRWSNSLYVWKSEPATWPHGYEIWHLVPNADGGFMVTKWPTFAPSHDLLDISTVSKIVIKNISVLDDGNLLVLKEVFRLGDGGITHILSVHRPDGSVIQDIILSYNAELSNVAMKSNGNFVYAQVTQYHPDNVCVIQETDKDGRALRNFHLSHVLSGFRSGCKQLFLGDCDRVIFLDGHDKCIFLDCELNFLGVVEIFEQEPVNALDEDLILLNADFDKDTNEMIVSYWSFDVVFLKLTL